MHAATGIHVTLFPVGVMALSCPRRLPFVRGCDLVTVKLIPTSSFAVFGLQQYAAQFPHNFVSVTNLNGSINVFL